MMNEESIPKAFGFADLDAVKMWGQTMNHHYRFNEEGDTCLYTDGDDGIALISISEVFEEDGLSIQLFDCLYCDFNYRQLGKIYRLLKKQFLSYEE